MSDVARTSTDYWLPHTECPACEECDHERCDPDRRDDPTQFCQCRTELTPTQRDAGES